MTQLRSAGPSDDSTNEGRFNLLWAGQAVSQFGDYLPYVSLPLFVKFLTDGTFQLAVTYALDSLPAVIVGLLGGALIDRLPLRRVMVVTDLLRALAFAFLAWLAATDPEPGSGTGLAAVFAVTFVAGTLAAFFNGALFTAVPRLVSGDRLVVANARLSGSQNVATILGPALAGVLISSFGFWPTFAINSATFLVSAATVAAVGRIDSRGEAPPPEPYRQAASAGLRYLWADERLRIATLAVAAVNFVTGFIEGTMVLSFELVGAAAEWQQGLLFTAMGVGALAGSILAPRVVRGVGMGRSMILGMFGFGSLFVLFVNGTYGPIAFGLLMVAFTTFQMLSVAYATLRQRYTPEHLLGRVTTASRAVAWTTLPVGALIGATLSDAFDFGIVVRVAPLGILLVGLAAMRTVLWSDSR